MSYKILTLFANVGVAETYLEKHGFKTVVYNELLPQRAKFYKHFHPKTYQVIGDIKNKKIQKEIIQKSIEKKVDIIMATPPCQGFSVAGKRIKDDPRNRLIFKTIDIIKKIKPKYVFIENVVQYFKDEIKYRGLMVKIPDVIKAEFSGDYEFNKAILDAKHFGVPQARRRGFILLSRKDVKKWEFPEKHKKIITVRDAIGHLPSLEPLVKGKGGNNKTEILNHERPIHNERHILAMSHTASGNTAHNNKKYFPKTKTGKRVSGFSTTYKRISWDKPAPTITMMNGSISSQNNVHPGKLLGNGLYSDPRVLTLREIFILSSLPPEWEYPKWASSNLIRRVIGEGIPPKLVEEIFKMIK